MDTSSPTSYMRRPRLPTSSTHHSSVGLSHTSAPAVLSPQASYYNTSPSQRGSGRNDIISTSSRSAPGYNPSEFKYAGYNTSSASPSSITTSSMHDAVGPTDHYASAMISPTHIQGQGLNAPKRAYRQRRKDPSCDACRERKVKCDATETSSCSECITRTVKCQFTKETNRRMSSIKQVQDLQSQLSEAKRTISRLQNMVRTTPTSGTGSPPNQSHRLPELINTAQKGRAIVSIPDFDGVRSSFRTHSRGVFKMPPMYRPFTPTPVLSTAEVSLPPRKIADTLLLQYYSYYNTHMPFIDWPAFSAQVDKCYALGTLQGVSQVWVSNFFGALACGSLQTVNRDEPGLNPDKDGIQYMVIASRLLNTWTDNLLLDHARTSLMVSMFLIEQNIRSAGWIWMGSGVRILQDIGLQLESGPWSAQEGEIRRLVYWAIFSYDRLLSLDGRPLQVYEDDVEVPWSLSSTEHWIPPDSPSRRSTPQPMIRTMPYIIPVIRIIPQLKKTIKSSTISRATLDTYDEYFRSILSSYPENLQINVETPLEPYLLHAVLPLQAARQLLYRHNMSPQCSVLERREAIERCLSVAYDTLSYIKRCLRWRASSSQTETVGENDGQEQFQLNVRFHANNFVCMHIWRTTLIFCLKQDFKAAITCAQLSKVIGDMRQLNIGCGRYLSRFLQRLKENCTNATYMRKTNSSNTMSGYGDVQETGTSPGSELDESEEMIAYASGDLQSDPDNAWIWAGVRGSSSSNSNNNSGNNNNNNNNNSGNNNNNSSNNNSNNSGSNNNTSSSNSNSNNNTQSKDLDEEALRGAQAVPRPTTALLTEAEKNDWGGWEGVEQVLKELVEIQHKARQRYYRPAHNPHKRVQLDNSEERPPRRVPASAAASRISIANII